MNNELEFLTLNQLIDYIETNLLLDCSEFIYNDDQYNEIFMNLET